MFQNPEALEAYRAHKALAGKLDGGGRVLLLARCGDGEGEPRLVVVPDTEHWPDDRLDAFVLLLDDAGRVRLLEFEPHSESGDWSESEAFCFDEGGRLRYWEFFRATVDSKEEPTQFWKARALNGRGELLESISLGLDGRKRLWKGPAPSHGKTPPGTLAGLLAELGIQDKVAALAPGKTKS